MRTMGQARVEAVMALDALADQMEQAGKLMALVKRNLRALSALGHGLLGEPIKADAQLTLNTLGREKTVTGILISHAFAEGLRATGLPDKASECDARVRAATRAFEM